MLVVAGVTVERGSTKSKSLGLPDQSRASARSNIYCPLWGYMSFTILNLHQQISLLSNSNIFRSINTKRACSEDSLNHLAITHSSVDIILLDDDVDLERACASMRLTEKDILFKTLASSPASSMF